MNVSAILGMAPAPTPPGTQANPQGEFMKMIGMIVIMFVMFYFIAIRPQRKKAQEHANMMKTLRPKDKIVTTSGILAEVITVKEKSVTIRSADAKMEITKSAIAEIVERPGDSSES